jgi:hypothetical protein
VIACGLPVAECGRHEPCRSDRRSWGSEFSARPASPSRSSASAPGSSTLTGDLSPNPTPRGAARTARSSRSPPRWARRSRRTTCWRTSAPGPTGRGSTSAWTAWISSNCTARRRRSAPRTRSTTRSTRCCPRRRPGSASSPGCRWRPGCCPAGTRWTRCSPPTTTGTTTGTARRSASARRSPAWTTRPGPRHRDGPGRAAHLRRVPGS